MARRRKAEPERALDPKVVKRLDAEGWERAGGDLTAESLNDGDVVTGVFQGLQDTTFTRDDGEPARVIIVETENGRASYWAPTILQSRVESFNPGDEVRIECLGKARTGSGRMAWRFDVRVKRHTPARETERKAAPAVKGKRAKRSKRSK